MQFMKSNNKIDEIFKFNEVEIVIVNNKKTELKIGFLVLYKFFQMNLFVIFLNNLKHMML